MVSLYEHHYFSSKSGETTNEGKYTKMGIESIASTRTEDERNQSAHM